jgi:hypothetical protein
MKRLAGIALSALATACAKPPPPAAFTSSFPPFDEGRSFVVVGDLQRTSWLEWWREQNDAERERVVRAIADERPAFLMIVGDLVFGGAWDGEWTRFDALATPLREAGVPVIAALGNHEYWGGRSGEPRFFARFPGLHGQRWYVRAWGPLRLVVLSSNEDEMCRREWRAQKRWYEQTLADLDRDPAVRGVLVLMHHPPYTNSTVTSDERHVQRDFVPAFLAARKTLALMTGHVHSYERFERQGKAFIVSGGGGGPRARLLSGAKRRHPDDLYDGPPLRDFNYVRIKVGADGLSAEVRGLAKGGRELRAIDRFFLRFP